MYKDFIGKCIFVYFEVELFLFVFFLQEMQFFDDVFFSAKNLAIFYKRNYFLTL